MKEKEIENQTINKCELRLIELFSQNKEISSFELLKQFSEWANQKRLDNMPVYGANSFTEGMNLDFIDGSKNF
jgi:hypothetical protein